MNENAAPVIEDLLENQTRWLHFMANKLVPWFDDRHDDLFQEGWIAMWKAANTYKPGKAPIENWMQRAARTRMLDVAYNDKPYFGSDADRTRWKIPEKASLDAIVEAGEGAVEDLLPVGQDVLKGVEIAYHRGEIIQAINQLPEEQREHVILRFWGGVEPIIKGEPRPTTREERTHRQERKAVLKDLAPQFLEAVPQAKAWNSAKEQLQEFLQHMREGYGD